MLVTFLQSLLEDQQEGRVRTLAEYQERFPGYEEAIAREYARLIEGAAVPEEATDRSPVRDSRPGGTSSLKELLRQRPEDPHAVAAGLAAEEASRPPAPAWREPPERLGTYRLLRELGRGGQGVVYLAEDTRLERKVALKVLAQRWDDSSAAWQRLRREALLTARLDHPGICTVYETESQDGVAFVAMQFVEGESLAERMAREQDPTRARSRAEILAACRLLEQAARAVHAAHQAGIVHRDLKPGNLMVTADERVVVLDFGLAREMADAAVGLTQTGDVFGTPAYMAPEQIRGEDRQAGPATDVHALGVILFEQVTGRRPFPAATREALFRAILSDAPPRIRGMQPAAPRDLEAVLQTALAKEPAHRYLGAGSFADDLQAVIGSRPVTASTPTTLTRLARWARRDPLRAALVAGLFAILLVAAGLAGYLAARRDEIREGQRAVEEQARSDLLMRVLGDYAGSGTLVMSGIEEDLQAHPELILPRLVLAMVHLENDELEEASRLLAGRPPDQADRRAYQLVEEEVRRRRAAGGAVPATPPADHWQEDPSTMDEYSELVAGWLLLESHRRTGQAGLISRARRHLDRAVLLSPRAEWVLAEIRTRILMMTEDRDALADAAHAMVRQWPESAVSWAWLGMARRLAENDIAGSREALAEAVRRDERNTKHRMWLCLAEAELGHLDEASRHYQTVVQAVRAQHPDQVWRQHWNFGNALLSLGHAAEAVEPLERALELQPEDRRVAVALARAYVQVGRTTDAMDGLLELLDRDPANQEASRLLCEALEKEGALLDLEEELRRRTEVAPEDGLAWCLLALLLDQEGDPDECEDVTVRAVRLRSGAAAERPDLALRLDALAQRLGLRDGDGPR